MIRNKFARAAFVSAVIAFSSVAAVQSGCIFLVAGAAAGGVAYVKGDLNATVSYPVGKVEKATVKALKSDLKFISISESEDATSAVYSFRNAKDEKITVKLDMVDDNSTKICIRIGTFGDESLSNLILSKIQKRLD
jgi:hypothetical protein